MKKLLLFLLLFLVNKNASIAQNREISLGIGGMFIKNAQTNYKHFEDSQNIFEGKDKDGNKIDLYQVTFTENTIKTNYTFQQSAVSHLSFKYRVPVQDVVIKVGVAFSFWKQSYKRLSVDNVDKILNTDTLTKSIFTNYAESVSPLDVRYKGSVLTYSIPFQISYPYKTWEFGIGASFDIPFLFQQSQRRYINNEPLVITNSMFSHTDFDFQFPKFERGKVGASININTIKWYKKIGIEIGVSESFCNILNIQDYTSKNTSIGNLTSIFMPNKPIQGYCKIIKRF